MSILSPIQITESILPIEIAGAAINGFPIFYIFWNFFLLLIPLFLGGLLFRISRREKKKLTFFSYIIFAVWLLFLPNAPYIIVDIRHISGYCGFASYLKVCVENAWMPIYFFSYASLGWIGYVMVLEQMRAYLKQIFGRKKALAIVLSLIPLTALGLLLGLLNRFNSWDFFLKPHEVINGALFYFTDYLYFRNLLLYTLILYILYFAGRYFFSKKMIAKILEIFNAKEL